MKNGRPHFMSGEGETPVCSFRRSSPPSTGLRAVECVPHPRAVCPASPPLGPPSEAAEPVVLSRKEVYLGSGCSGTLVVLKVLILCCLEN